MQSTLVSNFHPSVCSAAVGRRKASEVMARLSASDVHTLSVLRLDASQRKLLRAESRAEQYIVPPSPAAPFTPPSPAPQERAAAGIFDDIARAEPRADMVRVYIDGLTPSRKASTHIPKLVRRLTPALSVPSPRQSRCDDQLCSDAPAPYVTFGGSTSC